MAWFAISPVPTLLGANLPHSDTRWWRPFVEIVMSFSFHWVLFQFRTGWGRYVIIYRCSNFIIGEGSESSGFFAGTALLISNMMCIAVSGGSMNCPKLCPAVVAGVWKSHWMYWVGPYLGALFAAYYVQKTKEEKKEDED